MSPGIPTLASTTTTVQSNAYLHPSSVRFTTVLYFIRLPGCKHLLQGIGAMLQRVCPPGWCAHTHIPRGVQRPTLPDQTRRAAGLCVRANARPSARAAQLNPPDPPCGRPFNHLIPLPFTMPFLSWLFLSQSAISQSINHIHVHDQPECSQWEGSLRGALLSYNL